MKKLRKQFISELNNIDRSIIECGADIVDWRLDDADNLYDAEPMLVGNLESMNKGEIIEQAENIINLMDEKQLLELIDVLGCATEYTQWVEAKANGGSND